MLLSRVVVEFSRGKHIFITVFTFERRSDYTDPLHDGHICLGTNGNDKGDNWALTLLPVTLCANRVSGQAIKRCTENGTWFVKRGNTWTDYTACMDTWVSYHYYLLTTFKC